MKFTNVVVPLMGRVFRVAFAGERVAAVWEKLDAENPHHERTVDQTTDLGRTLVKMARTRQAAAERWGSAPPNDAPPTLADLAGVVDFGEFLAGWHLGLIAYSEVGLMARNPFTYSGEFSRYQGWECGLAACAATFGSPLSAAMRQVH